MKPVMQIIISKKDVDKHFVEAFHKLRDRYKEEYKVIATTNNAEILATNTTVVQLTMDKSTNLEELVKYLDAIPKAEAKLDGITEEKMQSLIQDLDDTIYEFQALKGDDWDAEIVEEQNHLVDAAREYEAAYKDPFNEEE